MPLALARKYRPKSFAAVAVQTHVANTLKGAIARGRVAHGYLLCGPRGTGKTTLARVLAMALNCERKRDDGEPCGECGSCVRIWAGSTSLDVVEIDAASNRGVDDARELRERAMYAPSGDDRYKVYIVDEAHMLTREAWNALLKILEEPPPRVVFVFATTDPQKIQQAAAPVLSRLQRFDLKRIGGAEIRSRVAAILDQEGIAVEPDALAMIARAADGSMRDALSLTDQILAFGDDRITADAAQSALGLVAEDELLALLDLVVERRAGDVFAATARFAEFGTDFALLLTAFADILRGQLAVELGGTLPEMTDRLRASLEERKGRSAPADLVRMLALLVEHEPLFRKSAQQQMLFESLLVRFSLIDRTVDLEDVLRVLGGGERSGARGGTPAAAPRSGEGTGGGGGRREHFRANDAETGRRDPPTRAEPPRGVAAKKASLGAGPGNQVTPRAGPATQPSPQVVAQSPAPEVPAAEFSPADDHSLGPAIVRQVTRGDVTPLADASARPRAALQTLDVNRLAEQWDDIAAELRAAGRGLVAQLVEESVPSAVTAAGVITLDAESELTVRGLAEAEATVLDALRRRFSGVAKLVVRAPATAPRKRYDATSVKAERVAHFRSDPLLAAAIDALDLELLE